MGMPDVYMPDEGLLWIQNALEMVTTVDLGADWQTLVRKWVEFEGEHGYKQEGKKLGSKGRPQSITDWIRRARNSSYRPVIRDVKAFEASFWTWWTTLQPEWRLDNASTGLLQGSGSWDALRCSGQNGLLSAIAALFFWGLSAEGNRKDKAAWGAVVDDVLYALTELSQAA